LNAAALVWHPIRESALRAEIVDNYTYAIRNPSRKSYLYPMPLLRHTHLPAAGELGIWKITEDEAWFRDRLLLYPSELRQLGEIKGRRRVEWLAARQLVHRMSGRRQRGAFVKDGYGKPHLAHSDWHISVSHSHELAAAVASPHLCGIDIQFIVPKITRLAKRFLSATEAASIAEAHQLDQLHFFWGAKEALYKAYGQGKLDFRKQLLVTPPANWAGSGETTGLIKLPGQTLDFHVYYERAVAGYMLVWAMAPSVPPDQSANS
jgi:4'-phosphopantetheinyl transferase